MKRFLTCVMLVLALSGGVSAAAAVPPVPTSFVTDKSHALSSGTAQALETQLHDYQGKTGHQVIVYIAPSTNGVPLEDFTSEAGHQWRVGQRGKDDGAILFLFTGDHKVRIEVGYGLESVLTDAKSREIIDTDIVPSMRAGNTDAAVRNGVSGIIAAIDGTAPATQGDTSSDDLPGWAVVLIVLFIIACIAVPIVIGTLITRAVRHATGQTAHNGSTSTIVTTGSSSWWNTGSGDSSSDSGFSFSGGGGDFGGGGASGSW